MSCLLTSPGRFRERRQEHRPAASQELRRADLELERLEAVQGEVAVRQPEREQPLELRSGLRFRTVERRGGTRQPHSMGLGHGALEPRRTRLLPLWIALGSDAPEHLREVLVGGPGSQPVPFCQREGCVRSLTAHASLSAWKRPHGVSGSCA